MNRIDIKEKSDCVGCGACADICPKGCILMKEDSDGFIYPYVNGEQCVLCGRCISVCPVTGADKVKNGGKDRIAYAYASNDSATVRMSSSGGAFSAIMDGFSDIGGKYAIVGAAICGTEVRHRAVESRSDADIFRKSKYVQSRTDGIFRKVSKLLGENTRVLFSGTPCQAAALKRYIGKDSPNLITVDIVCHGVPNETVFSEYIKETEKLCGKRVLAAEFRYKRGFDGEKVNPRTLRLTFDDGSSQDFDMSESEYLYAYYTGLLYRPSCKECRFACAERPGDITLGDYWGIEKIHPELSALRGVSLVRFNTDKGEFLKDRLMKSGIFKETDYGYACRENDQLMHTAHFHRNHDKFFALRRRGVPFRENVNICRKPDTVFKKAARKVINILKHS